MAFSKAKSSKLVQLDTSSDLFKSAKRLAKFYRLVLKGEVRFWHEPWSPDVPVEDQTVFKHFIKAAKLVIESGGDERSFVRAQFDGLKWARAFPYPAQLHSPNARLRFMAYQERKESRTSKAVTEDDFMVDEFELQEGRLDKMVKSTGLPEAKVLRIFRKRFTKPFLRSKGVL